MATLIPAIGSSSFDSTGERRLAERCPVLVSPVQATLAPQELAEWVLADRLPVRFQVQLHKLLWGNMQGK